MRALLGPPLTLLLVLGLAGCVSPAARREAEAERARARLVAEVVAPEDAAEAFLDGLDARLIEAGHGLTPAQRAALQPVVAEASVEGEALARREDASAVQARAQARALAARTDARVEALLTPAQVPVFRRYRAEVGERIRATPLPRGAGG